MSRRRLGQPRVGRAVVSPASAVLIAAGLVLSAFASPAPVGIIVERLPLRTGGPASDTAFELFDEPFFQRSADEFVLSEPAVIRRVTWWGFYGGDEQNHDPPAGDETMRIRVYGSRPGDNLPNDLDILFHETYLNPTRTATGLTIAVQGRPAEYYYEVDLDDPIHLHADTLYWLEIVQVGDAISHFRWETGFGVISGHAVLNPSVAEWTSSGGSFAFRLSSIPEPSTSLLVLMSLAFTRPNRSIFRNRCGKNKTSVVVGMGSARAHRARGSLRRIKASLTAGVLVLSSLTSPALAGIIVDQLPGQLGGQASDTSFISASSGAETFQRIADNVMVDEIEVIRRIGWWGFYGGDEQNHEPPTGDETMRIRVYGARPGDSLPYDSNILLEESYLNPARTATGLTIAVQGRPAEYYYEVDLDDPLHLQADTLYWLEIVQVGDADSHFRWETGFGVLNGRAFINANVADWQFISGSHAFRLSAIPEPSTMTLAVFAVSLVRCKSVRRKHRDSGACCNCVAVRLGSARAHRR